MSKTVLFQIIQFSIVTHFKCKYDLIVKTSFLFQAIQFSQIIQFSISGQLSIGYRLYENQT